MTAALSTTVRRNVTVGAGRAVHAATVYVNDAGKVTGGFTDCGSEGRRPGSSRLSPVVNDVTCKRCAAGVVAEEPATEPEETVGELLDRVAAEPAVARRLARAEERARHEEAATRRAVAAEEDGTDGLVHLMSDALLDACGTAGPGGLHLAPSTTPERITCPRCLLYAVDEEVQRLGYRNAALYLDARPELRERVEVAADAPDSTAPIPVDLGEADVPPTAEERVEVAIRARELRPGDLVAGPTGYVAHAAFDVQLVDEPGEPVVVRVWTAIRDQERGLPPVVQYNAEREVRVLRPVSDEGRELLARAGWNSTPAEPTTRAEWEQRVGMPWAEYERAMSGD